MKRFIKNELRQLYQRLTEMPSEFPTAVRMVRAHPWQYVVRFLLAVTLMYLVYYAPYLGHWVRHGSFPR